MRRLIASLLVAGCVLAAAACGGGGGGGSDEPETVDPVAYAGSVCAALERWQANLEEGSAVLAAKIETEQDLTEVRSQFVTFFGDALAETDRMLEDVEGAGVPEVAEGEKVSASLLASLRRFRPILIETRKNASNLPVGDEAAFTTNAQSLGGEFRAATLELPTLLETVAARHGAQELTRAARADSNCQQL